MGVAWLGDRAIHDRAADEGTTAMFTARAVRLARYVGAVVSSFQVREAAMPVRWLIYGMYGAINVGDELVAQAAARGLRHIFPRCEVIVMTSSPARSAAFAGSTTVRYLEAPSLGGVFWLRLHRVFRDVRQADAIIVGGGGLFQDQYSWHLPAASALAAALGLLYRKRTFILGVGVGPLRRRWLRRTIRRVFTRVDAICVRDDDSSRTVRALGVPADRLFVTADLVPAAEFHRDTLGTVDTLGQAPISFILRAWPGIDAERLARLFDRLVESEHRLRLQCYEPAADAQFYRTVLARAAPKTVARSELFAPANAAEAFDAIRQSACVVSMRLHGCILCLELGIPFVPVQYERKVKALAEQAGLSDLLKSVSDLSPGLLADLEAVPRYWATHGDAIRERYTALRRHSRKNFEVVSAAVASRAPTRVGARSRCAALLTVSSLLFGATLRQTAHILTAPIRRCSTRRRAYRLRLCEDRHR